jgi:hypothetical protein
VRMVHDESLQLDLGILYGDKFQSYLLVVLVVLKSTLSNPSEL